VSATRIGGPSAAGTPTSNECAPSSTARPAESTSAPAASRPARSRSSPTEPGWWRKHFLRHHQRHRQSVSTTMSSKGQPIQRDAVRPVDASTPARLAILTVHLPRGSTRTRHRRKLEPAPVALSRHLVELADGLNSHAPWRRLRRVEYMRASRPANVVPTNRGRIARIVTLPRRGGFPTVAGSPSAASAR
jgi:hypothetical protein